MSGINPDATILELEETLVNEAEEYRQLVSLAEHEHTALKSNDLDELNKVIREKQAIMPELTRWTSRREQLTAALAARFNLPTNATLTDLLAHIEGAVAEKLIQIREEFVELMEQLIMLNHTNKMILQTELVRVNSTYDYIAAMLAEPREGYAPDGKNQPARNHGNILNWEV